MSDNYFKIDGMTNDQILTEMETLRKKQFTVKSETPIWYQIQDMIDFCTQEYQARVMRDRVSNDKTSDVMETGELDSVDYTPDYSERDTFVEMVSFYSGDNVLVPIYHTIALLKWHSMVLSTISWEAISYCKLLK